MATASSSSPSMPNLSALSSLIAASASPSPLSASTIQILHNLQHQHLWTSLKVHDIPIPVSNPATTDDASPSTLFLISGIPPHRVYTHPDEQLYMLQKGLRENDVELERMFVLPTVHGQSWSLRKLAAVFDSLPDAAEEEALGASSVDEGEERAGPENGEKKAASLAEYYGYRQKARQTGEWGTKRLLLAMVDKSMGGDGTVVYYVVQEGAVKPRQN